MQLDITSLFFGKTKVMAVALGSTPSSANEPSPGISSLCPYLTGSVGLLFTLRTPDSILSYFADYAPLSYARAGVSSARSFTLPAGVVYSRGGELATEDDVPMSHGVESTLRKWGVPTRLVEGKVELEDEYRVCGEGEVLDSRQTAILKQFGVQTSEFRVRVKA